MRYCFEWDPAKALRNRQKHRVTFAEAATALRDPRALSLYDAEHSGREDRWTTLGVSATGTLLVVHHTYEEVSADAARIRVFSCRRATRRETRQYLGEQ